MPLITQQRHRDNLKECIKCIDNYLKHNEFQDFVLVTEELRNASKYLGMNY
jgi:tRNA U34 5-carboxymethylaminomethyl modifying GTPase MnmE/TrmE